MTVPALQISLLRLRQQLGLLGSMAVVRAQTRPRDRPVGVDFEAK